MSSNLAPGVTGNEDYFYPPDYGDLEVMCPGCDTQMTYDDGSYCCPLPEDECGHIDVAAADAYDDMIEGEFEAAMDAKYDSMKDDGLI